MNECRTSSKRLFLKFLAVVLVVLLLCIGALKYDLFTDSEFNSESVNSESTAAGEIGLDPRWFNNELWHSDMNEPIALRDYSNAGKLVIVNFWATWCPPCRHEIPNFVTYQQMMEDEGVRFIGVPLDDKDKVAEFSDSVGMNYPNVFSKKKNSGQQWLDQVAGRRSPLPYTVVYDETGRLVERKVGIVTTEELGAWFERYL